ncbi:MAG: HAMP domain-containing protein [Gammaproteobacteria bacterium]|nr:HAMP domain-containing protein [Gammaproteobacteria bacterium]
MSLRARLLIVLLSATAVTTVIATCATYYWARHEIDELFDYHLRQQALALRDKAAMLGAVVVPEPDPEQDIVIQAWNWRGERIYLSHREVDLPRSEKLGYANLRSAHADWRVYAVTLGSQLIQIAQPMQLRRTLATQAALKILYPLLAALPVLALLIWWLVGRVLTPLGDLARTIVQRQPQALSPIAAHGLPSEAKLMVEALNDLIERLRDVLSRQREFMADAAHELRTPLTALQLQTQLLERVGSGELRAAAIAELKAGVQRAAHLVERLLTFARLEPASHDHQFAEVDLAVIARELVERFAETARTQNQRLNAAIATHAVLTGNEAGLHSLLNNLIENALRCTPRDGTVALDLTTEAEAIALRITDTGPGIPETERERIFDRFYRIPGTASHGSGLGLAIVKRVVDLHRGTISVGVGPGGIGAEFRVSLPRATGVPTP